MKDINTKMAKGAVWMVAFKLVQRSITLVSTLVLARVLVPADFGLVAMAMVIITMFELVSAFSFDVVLIQNQQADRSHYDTAWTFNVLFSTAAALMLVLLAAPAAQFYRDPRLEHVVYWLALGVLIQGFENIGVVAFRKELDFHLEFKFQLAKKLIAFAVTIALAIWWRNYWALVAGTVTSKAVGALLSYRLHPYRPRLSLAAHSELFHFSKWLMINNVLFYVNDSATNFIIGRVAGSHALGLYTISFEISNMPTTEMVAPINRAIFPGYAKMASDLSVLREGFLNVLGMIAFVALPVGAGIAVTAPSLVRVLLGEQWVEAAALIPVLSVYGMLIAMQTNIGSIYLALGRPRLLTAVAAMSIGMMLVLVLIGAQVAASLGAAWGLAVSAAIMFPVNYVLVTRRLEMTLARSMTVLWRPLLATGMMVSSALWLRWISPPPITMSEHLVLLSASAVVGAAVYGAATLLTWRLAGKPWGAEARILGGIDAWRTRRTI